MLLVLQVFGDKPTYWLWSKSCDESSKGYYQPVGNMNVWDKFNVNPSRWQLELELIIADYGHHSINDKLQDS